MKSIGEFFSRIRNSQAKELFLRGAVRDSLLKHNIDVEVSKISLKGRSIVIKGLSQSSKSQVFIKKTHILEEVKEKTGLKLVDNILV